MSKVNEVNEHELTVLQGERVKEIQVEDNKYSKEVAESGMNVSEFLKLNEDARLVYKGLELKWDRELCKWAIDKRFVYDEWDEVNVFETKYEAMALKVLGNG